MQILKHTRPFLRQRVDTAHTTESLPRLVICDEISPTPRTLPTCIRVQLFGEHEIARQALGALLREQIDFAVTGQAGQIHDAVSQARETQPDIILLDVRAEAWESLEVARQLLQSCSHTAVVLLTDCTSDEQLFQALQLGVHGYLQKSLPVERFLEALRAIYRGELILNSMNEAASTSSMERLDVNRPRAEVESRRCGLNTFDIELVRLAADGLSNKEIADRQFWSELDVKRRMQDIYQKLQVTDRAQAVSAVTRMGLL